MIRFVSIEEIADLLRDGSISSEKWGKCLDIDSDTSVSTKDPVLFCFTDIETSECLDLQYWYLPMVEINTDVIGQGVASYHKSSSWGDYDYRGGSMVEQVSECYIERYSTEDVTNVALLKNNLDAILDEYLLYVPDAIEVIEGWMVLDGMGNKEDIAIALQWLRQRTS